jgi:preprotein translocase subunit YajC
MRSRVPFLALRAALVAAMPVAALAFGACGSDTAAPSTGAVRVTATTTGTPVDPDGYLVTVDGSTARPLAVNGDVTVESLLPGAHMVALSGLAVNCTVAEAASRTVTVAAGETATVAFALTCAPVGSVNVSTVTTGTAPDVDGYTVMLDQGAPQAIGHDSTVTLAGVAPGTHFVTLAGLAANCRAPDQNPRVITVAEGTATEVTFAVFCPGP